MEYSLKLPELVIFLKQASILSPANESFISNNIRLKIVKAKSDVIANQKESQRIITDKVNALKVKMENMASVISKISPLEVLKRGFAVVERNGEKVSTVKTIKKDDEISLNTVLFTVFLIYK